MYRKEVKKLRSHKIQRAVRRSDFTPAETILMNALIDLVDWQTWATEATLKTLVKETRLNKATITRRLKSFESKGFIKRRRNGDERGFTRTGYEIQVKALELYLSQWMPKSKNAEDIPLGASGDKVGASDNTLVASDNTLVASGNSSVASGTPPLVPQATTNQPSKLNLNSNQENQPSKSPQECAQGASKEVRRYPKDHFFAGAIILDGDDWEPEIDPENEKAWKEGGYTRPTREELRKIYK